MNNFKCNLCEKSRSKTILEFLPKDYHGQVLQKHTLEKCLSCGLIQLEPKPSQEENTVFYGPNYYTQNQQTEYAQKMLYRTNKEKVLYLLRRNPFQLISKFIKRILSERTRFLKNGSRLLDVGCGNGVFLLNLARATKKRNYSMELSGVDIFPPDNKALENHGIRLFGGGFTVNKFPPGYFDFIVAHHSIEHFDNPADIFNELYKITKKGGLLALEVPNIASFSYAVFKKYWSGIATIGHVFYFSPKTLKDYVRRAGFKIIKIRFTEDPETFLFSLLRKLKIKESKVEIIARNPILNIIFWPGVELLNLFKIGDSIEIILTKE
ncbi:MAG: class I SAM-dependent methyltransferase [Patescibacteria group bacterium]|nr:class I SAM-dependent methyltransferase [Patescibacteria group bacterium]